MKLTVPSVPGVTMSVTGPIEHECPYVDEHDTGTITITWETREKTLELHDLSNWLTDFTLTKISHEALTRNVHDTLKALPGITLISVTTTWNTAGMEVACTSSPIRAVVQQ